MTQTNAKIALIFVILTLFLVACGGSVGDEEVSDGTGETETVTETGSRGGDDSSTEETVGDTSGDTDSAEGGRGRGEGDPTAPDTIVKAEPTRAVSADSGGWVDGSPADSVAEFRTSDAEESDAYTYADDAGASVEAEPMLLAEGSAPPAAEPRAGADTSVAQNSVLTAGGVDDNENWDDYLLYLRDYSGASVLEVDVSERHQIRVTDASLTDMPILSALITISANDQEVATLRTHSNGLAYFFPKALPAQSQAESYTVRVNVGESTEEFVIDANSSQRLWEVNLASNPLQDRVRLDVLFLIDATGSMGDEIAQLKENIRAIAAQIEALPSQPDVRFAMTVYRDQGDDYVSRTFDFTPNVEAFAEALADVEAGGGGDYPEDLNEGLSRAIHAPEWRVEETVSLVFLVADAPPHLDYGQENHYAAEIVEAAKRGIKIYPIASSGLDEQGEYVFRQLAQYTGGEFIFLTYGAGGAGTTGTETTHNVDDYSVLSLDELVIQIVEEELAFRTR